MAIEIFDGGSCKAAGVVTIPSTSAQPAPAGRVQGVRSMEAIAANVLRVELEEGIAQTEFVGFANIAGPLVDTSSLEDSISPVILTWIDATHIEIRLANNTGAKGTLTFSAVMFAFYRFVGGLLTGENNVP